MIVGLDHWIFGSGYGLGSPFWDDVFYWLKDAETKRGELYSWSGWFGSQLQSFQWRHPRAGERRRLAGYEFVVMHSARSCGRVRVSWSWIDIPKGLDDANEALRKLRSDLNEKRGRYA